MKTVFSKIYEGLDMLDDLYKTKNLEDQDLRVYDLEDEVREEMPEEIREKFEEWESLRGENDRKIEEAVFTRGVRLGMQLMLDAILEREKMKYEKKNGNKE